MKYKIKLKTFKGHLEFNILKEILLFYLKGFYQGYAVNRFAIIISTCVLLCTLLKSMPNIFMKASES